MKSAPRLLSASALVLATLLSLNPALSRADGQPAPSPVRASLETTLDFMQGTYQAEYAPAGWKKAYAGWDLATEIQKARAAATAITDLSVADARRILMDFVYSMKDYHVSISFQSTEVASLPFVVQSAGDKYFLAFIDRTKLSQEAFPFQVGDEVKTFGDKPTAQAVADVQAQIPANIPGTDKALATLRLTKRTAARGLVVPQGPINLGILPKGATQVVTTQLIWDYTAEQVSDGGVSGTSGFAPVDLTNPISHLASPVMSCNLVDSADLGESNPFDLGARKTFTPDLGTKIWESEEDSPFYAYIYQTADRRLVGYLRLPNYTPDDADAAIKAFGDIIGKFEQVTDAMVIDQVNNPGGSVFYLYTLASMLTPNAISTPQHKMAITQADVLEAVTNLKGLSEVKNDDDAKKALGPTLMGYPSSYEVAQFLKGYFQFIVSEWNAGRRLTRPYWIAGVDHINPAAVHYTKPILLLVNELDFSGGDFFPATMQDNKRVTILGTRTAGAGGYVNDVSFPNDLGVAAFRVTESIAKRVDDNPIENLGVKPDIAYSMTEDDVSGGYQGYAQAVRDAVAKLLPQ